MKLAVVAADYTPGEADQLRRDMAAWRSSGRIEQHHERLVTRMVHKGIAPEFAERVFQQIRGFGEYGFPERHYLPEFTCALLNAQPMGFYSVATIVEDSRRHGLEVRPVCVRHSDWDCTLEGEKLALRMGLRSVKGLAEADARRLVEARTAQPFQSADDFSRRTQLPRRSLQVLAEAGALESFGSGRRESLCAGCRGRRETRCRWSCRSASRDCLG
jgi:error-prone DNA polymerase